MSTRIRRSVKSKKRSRKQMEEPKDERSDSDGDHSDNYTEPSTKKRKLATNDGYAKTFRETLKRTSILLQNAKQDKFIEIGMNSDSKSYSVIKGKLGTNGTKQIKAFKTKKNAWNVAIKALTDRMRKGYTIVESEGEAEEEEEEMFASSSSSEDIDMVEGIFDGLSFSMSGGLSKPQITIEKIITTNGGKVTNTVDAQHTDFILVKNKNAFTQSKKCVAANTLNIPIVKEQFVHDSIHQDKITDYKLYLVDQKTDRVQDIPVSDSSGDTDHRGADIQATEMDPIPDMEPLPMNDNHNNRNNNNNASLSKEEVSYNYNYLSSALSLRTTDECIKAELLVVTDAVVEMETELNCMKMQQDAGQILAEIKNVFTEQECQRIIQQSNRLSFQNMSKSNKYQPSVRKSDRLVVLDEKLSNVIWDRLNRVIKRDIIDTYYVSTTPLGFGVLNDVEQNKWEVSSINTAMRINRYNANSDDFFTFHKDAQYAPSAEERSLFTLIIYLNDDFEGGQTNFYFDKNEDEEESANRSLDGDYTINEEIAHLGGIKEGFDCKTIEPSMGDAIIFSPDVIHEGCKLVTPNKYKYILKTEVVVQRQRFDGFAISLEESDDYQRCLNYFMDAQHHELQGNNEKANELYERSLSIRYSYPKKLQQNHAYAANRSSALCMNVDNIWLTIFEYSEIREMECVSYLFPQLHPLLIKYKMLFHHSRVRMKDEEATEPYIPNVVQQCGQYHSFEWIDSQFYREHEYDCCRVAAIYAFYLLSHRQDSKYFIAEYNAHSQQIVAVPLRQLLRNVFYHRQCHGAYFKIKQGGANEDENIRRDFNENVDRDYMSAVHGAQFVGGVGLMTDNVFKADIKPSVEQKNTYHEELPSKEEWLSSCKMNAITEFMSEPTRMTGCYEVDTCCGDMKHLEKWLGSKLGAIKGDDKAKYLEDLKAIKKGDTGVFGAGKTRVLDHYRKHQEYCLCPFRDNAFRFVDDLEAYNHLIFDFSKTTLEVTEENVWNVNSDNMDNSEEGKNECGVSCVSLRDVIKTYVTSKAGESRCKSDSVKFCKVNITSLVEDQKSMMSFNHASCQCCYPVTDADISNYFGYSHLKHVHIATMQTQHNKVLMWLAYNNIAAL